MVKDTRGIDYLETKIVVVSVTDIKGFCCEGVGLHLDVGSAHAVYEAGFAYVRIPCQQNCTLIRVNSRQSAHVLPHFLKVSQR